MPSKKASKLIQGQDLNILFDHWVGGETSVYGHCIKAFREVEYQEALFKTTYKPISTPPPRGNPGLTRTLQPLFGATPVGPYASQSAGHDVLNWVASMAPKIPEPKCPHGPNNDNHVCIDCILEGRDTRTTVSFRLRPPQSIGTDK